MSSTADKLWYLMLAESDAPCTLAGDPAWPGYRLTLQSGDVTIEGLRATRWDLSGHWVGLSAPARYALVNVEGMPIKDYLIKELGLGDA